MHLIMKFLGLIPALLFSTVHAQAGPPEKEADRAVSRTIPLVSAEVLSKEMKGGAKPVLLDTRRKEEFAVSHLVGATWVGFEKFDLKKLPSIAKNAPVIVYCSIGFRSEKIGKKLRSAGYENVRNLSGGIFGWASDGRAMVDDADKPTKAVHGYDKNWEKRLNPEVPRKLSE